MCSNLLSSISISSGEDSLDRLLPPTGAPRRKSTTLHSKSEPPLLRTGTRTIYTAGRPPWYDEHGAQSKEAFVIGRMMILNVFLESAEPAILLQRQTTFETLWKMHKQAFLNNVRVQGCVAAAPQGKPQLPIRSSRLWTCPGLCCCLWILFTRSEKTNYIAC